MPKLSEFGKQYLELEDIFTQSEWHHTNALDEQLVATLYFKYLW